MAGLGLGATPLVLLLALPALERASIQLEDFEGLLLSRSCAQSLGKEVEGKAPFLY